MSDEGQEVPASATLKTIDRDSPAWRAAEAQAREEQPGMWHRPMPRRRKQTPPEMRTCDECGALYTPRGRGDAITKTCSETCRQARRKRLDREKSKRTTAARREKRAKAQAKEAEPREAEAKCNLCGKWSLATMSRPRSYYVCEACDSLAEETIKFAKEILVPPDITGVGPPTPEPIDKAAAELWLERLAMLHGKDLLTNASYLRAVKLLTWRQTGVNLEV